MNLEKVIRFGFASRRRKLLTLTLAGAAGITALVGGGTDKPTGVETPKSACEATSPYVAVPCDPDGQPLTTRTTTTVAEVFYRNCAEARAAGAAPLRIGDAGYRSALDRDGDGI